MNIETLVLMAGYSRVDAEIAVDDLYSVLEWFNYERGDYAGTVIEGIEQVELDEAGFTLSDLVEWDFDDEEDEDVGA